jgi:parallel beta-helix repeat protein
MLPGRITTRRHNRRYLMGRRILVASTVLMLALLGLAAIASPATALAGDTIVVTSTIQAAVDAAQPGDTILVPPGTYRETVLVDKSNLTIAGSPGAILDAAGFRTGIRVGTGRISREGPVPTCPSLAVTGFTLRGLTVKHASFSGVFLIGVDGYHLTGTSYLDNPVYGPFPVCSHDGLIDFNHVVGGGSAVGPSTDTGIYVGDDDRVTVRNNSVTNYVVGVVVENTINATVQDNLFKGNTAGIYAAVLPNHPRPFTDNVVIERNQVVNNNLPNPVPADSGDSIGLVPTGVGIVNFGGDHVVVRNNRVLGNDSLGVIVLQNFLASADSRIEPNSDFVQVRGNVILQNGHNPDPVRAVTPGADIVYDGTGTGNCFADNVFATEYPAGITASFPCGD